MKLALEWYDGGVQSARIVGLPTRLVDCHGLQFGVVVLSYPSAGDECWLAIVNGVPARAVTPTGAAKLALARAKERYGT
jgi:hypothetical protein